MILIFHRTRIIGVIPPYQDSPFLGDSEPEMSGHACPKYVRVRVRSSLHWTLLYKYHKHLVPATQQAKSHEISPIWVLNSHRRNIIYLSICCSSCGLFVSCIESNVFASKYCPRITPWDKRGTELNPVRLENADFADRKTLITIRKPIWLQLIVPTSKCNTNVKMFRIPKMSDLQKCQILNEHDFLNVFHTVFNVLYFKLSPVDL